MSTRGQPRETAGGVGTPATGRVRGLGAWVLTIGLVALLLAISKGQLWGWAAPSTLALRTAEVVILIAFVFVELPKEAFKPRRSR